MQHCVRRLNGKDVLRMETTNSNQKRKRSAVPVLIGLLLFVLLLGGGYGALVWRYQTVFLPGTSVNGVSVAGQTVEKAEQSLSEKMKAYILTLKERDDQSETVSGEDIDLTVIFDGSVEQLMEEQNPFRWPLAMVGREKREATLELPFTYDEDALSNCIDALNCMDEEQAEAPKDAYLSDYSEEEGGVHIVPEEQGTTVDREKLVAAIQDAIEVMEPELDLDEAGCYIAPEITSENEQLNEDMEHLNAVYSLEITYQFGEDTVTLDGKTLSDWISVDDDHNVTVSEEKAEEFVRGLAEDYNTIFSDRNFKTSYGTEVVVEKGDYGWWMDEDTETAELIEQIKEGKSGTREPVWRQEAVAFGSADSDYGDTYVEINLTAQHLFFYKDGELVLESDFVSGKNDATPTGTYGVTYCERYATLKGENYASPVSYWMPFSGNVGMHDASWRTSFGGSLYKSGGSHGCVNLPVKVAKQLYQNIEAGTAVIVYKLPGTESGTTTSQSAENIADNFMEAVEEIADAGKITSGNYNVMKKRINWADEAYDALSGSVKSKVTNTDTLKQLVKDLKAYQKANGLSS